MQRLFWTQTEKYCLTATPCYFVVICCCDHVGPTYLSFAGVKSGMHSLYWSFRCMPIWSDIYFFADIRRTMPPVSLFLSPFSSNRLSCTHQLCECLSAWASVARFDFCWHLICWYFKCVAVDTDSSASLADGSMHLPSTNHPKAGYKEQ